MTRDPWFKFLKEYIYIWILSLLSQDLMFTENLRYMVIVTGFQQSTLSTYIYIRLIAFDNDQNGSMVLALKI